ncbi:MAG: hypothetical protein BGO69_14070 [Bacteroidetes bacterium 46-16]|nr:MAG: hypothetical protein BGO69_14070 [Bacteroidetes bacterium 46-16]
MKKLLLLILFAGLYQCTDGQNTKRNQVRDTISAPQHNPPRHRHQKDDEKSNNKTDTARGKLNKEKNGGNVLKPQPDK